MAAHLILFFDGETIPEGWTLVSDTDGPFYHKFIRGAPTYGGTGGAETHTHSCNLISCGNSDACSRAYTRYDKFNAEAWPLCVHTHSIGSITLDTKSNIPTYRSLKVIRCDAGLPEVLPVGVIAIFDVTPPEGWTRLSAQDGRYVYGDPTSGSEGGENSHSHVLSGSTNVVNDYYTSWEYNGFPYTRRYHYHEFSQSSDSVNHEPPYVEVYLGRNDSETTIPTGLIGLFDDVPPAGWTILSDTEGLFHHRFLKPVNGFGGTGGSETHSHANISGSTGPDVGQAYPNGTGPTWQENKMAARDHHHQMEFSVDSASHLPPYIDVIIAQSVPLYGQTVKSIQANVASDSETTKSVGLNVHLKPAECRPVKAFVANCSENTKSIKTLIQQYGTAIKDIIADVVYYSWRTKTVQTKIWWDSGKTLRNVQTKVGSPAVVKLVTARTGFPTNTKPVGLKTPLGYSETWKSIQLKAEKYSEMVTRIVVTDTRPTTRGFMTKLVSLNIGKFPYNAKSTITKVEQYGKSIKSVGCDIYLAKGQSIKSVGCKVNKSRQIINVGLSVQEYTGESTIPVGLSTQPHGEVVKNVSLSVWSDIGEMVKAVSLSAEVPGEAHKPVKLSVWSDIGEMVKAVSLSVVTRPETYKTVRANVSPTHRWTPVSADIVRSGADSRGVQVNIINEVWAFDWQTINAKIEKYVAHTKNIRARRIVQANVCYTPGYCARSIFANVTIPSTNTCMVRLKIHMYTVYGTITDEEGDPVKDAIIFLYKRGSGEFITAKTTKTDTSGYYEIPEVPYGDYHVIVIKQANTLNFAPITMNGAHTDVEQNLPLYKVGKDTCLEEIMSPQGDLFRFQVLYDEVFPDYSRVIEILMIWGDLYNQLPTYYRATDGLFKLETPTSARLTVLHDFWETGGKRSEGKDDHFITPIENVSEFMWLASLYSPNFVGFIVRCNTRGDVYTIMTIKIGKYVDREVGIHIPPEEEPGIITPRSYPPRSYPVRAITTRPVRCCLPLQGIVGCPTACTREVSCRLPPIANQSIISIGCNVTYYGTASTPVLCHLPYRGTTAIPIGCCLPLQGIVGCPNFSSRPVGLHVIHYFGQTTRSIKCNCYLGLSANTRPVGCCLPLPGIVGCPNFSSRPVKCYVRYPVICDLVGRLPGLLYPGYVSYPTVSGFILDESGQPTSGTVDVIDKETGILLYHCNVDSNGWYSFAVPPNRCYILVMCKPGYQCQMIEVCIGTTPLVDRNVTKFGGTPFTCEINCYYYIRAFEFAPLVPLEDYYVYGHVYNSKTLEPLRNVLVVAGDYEGTAVSGVDGYYKINMPTGTYDLKASKHNFKRAKATVTITSGVEQNLYLDPIVAEGFYQRAGLRYIFMR